MTAIESASPFTLTICLYLAAAQLSALTELLSPLQRTGLITAPQTTTIEQKPVPPVIQPYRIGRFLILTPDSPDRSPSSDIAIRLATTPTFGSGLHPTTIVSLRLLERHLQPDLKALDLGSGSGILSVAMAKLGAQVVAIDNDPIAVQATQAATQLNQVESQVTAQVGSLGQGSQLGHWMNGHLNAVPAIEPAANFDLIVTNILARVHVALAPDYRRALRAAEGRSRLITAGFTLDFADPVDAALQEAGFVAVDREQHQEWVALAHALASDLR